MISFFPFLYYCFNPASLKWPSAGMVERMYILRMEGEVRSFQLFAPTLSHVAGMSSRWPAPTPGDGRSSRWKVSGSLSYQRGPERCYQLPPAARPLSTWTWTRARTNLNHSCLVCAPTKNLCCNWYKALTHDLASANWELRERSWELEPEDLG